MRSLAAAELAIDAGGHADDEGQRPGGGRTVMAP